MDASTAVLQDSPTVSSKDIISYSQGNYRFELTDAAFRKMQAVQDRTPLAVAIDGQVVYYGFVKPGFSSSSCLESITMDWASGNRIDLRLGYPGAAKDADIDDQRNNPKLLATLASQGKLK